MSGDSEFFIGWQGEQPPGIAQRVRLAVAIVAVAASVAAGGFVAAQHAFARSAFEYGEPRRYAGTLFAKPVPVLWIERAASQPADGARPFRIVPVVAPGKFGAGDLVRPFDGRRVELEATWIHRGEGEMLELVPASIHETGAAAPPTPGIPLGHARLRGEIVDSKCFLGVMNPGEGKVHRDCAARCIDGGIPPALWVRDDAGHSVLLLLVKESGSAFGRELLDRVAEPVEVDGDAIRLGDLTLLRTSADRIRRLP